VLIPGRRSTCFCRAIAGSVARARSIAAPKILNFTTEAPSFSCGHSGSCNYLWTQFAPVQNFGLRPRATFKVIWGNTKINMQLIPFSKSPASWAVLDSGKIRREEPCDFIEVRAWLHDAAGLSLARRNCGVIDDQIYIVDVGAAWANRRYGTTCRHAPGTARLLPGRFSFLPKLPRRRHGRAAMPPAKSHPIVDVLPQGFRRPRNVGAPMPPPSEWRGRTDST